jgi:hypothetical protein
VIVAESTLAIHQSELRKSVALLAGWGLDSNNWKPDQRLKIDYVIDRGMTRTYGPVVLPGETNSHTWSFMEPVLTSIHINGQYSTGTITVVSGVATLAGGTWPSWAADANLVVNGLAYPVYTRDSGTQITLNDLTVNYAALTTYAISQADYPLPDDFAAFTGDLYFTSPNGSNGYHPIRRSDMNDILRLRSRPQTGTTPFRFAVQPVISTGTGQQQWMLSLWPNPIASAEIVGKYILNPNKLTVSATYPLGGYPFSEVLREGCLAACETEIFGQPGPHYEQWIEQLRCAVSFDRRSNNPSNLGPCNNPSVVWPNSRGGNTPWLYRDLVRFWDRTPVFYS